MELIEYKRSLKAISNEISCLEFCKVKDKDMILDIFAKFVDIESKIKADIDKSFPDPKNGDACTLLTMIRVSLKECVKVTKDAHDKAMIIIYTCKPIINQCLEVLEDYTISNKDAKRRYMARKAMNSHITDVILITKDVQKNDICSRYAVIEKLLVILEYIERELEVERDNDQTHVYIKTLKNLNYDTVHALDFFLTASIMFQIDDHEYYHQAMGLVIKLRSDIERRLSIEPEYDTEEN